MHKRKKYSKNKICPECREKTRHKTLSGRYDHYCLPCRQKREKEYYRVNKDRFKIRAHRKRIKRYFGLSPDEYKQLFIKQNNVCGICGREEKHRRLSIDHNHKTDEIRGLLCSSCNFALGWLERYTEPVKKWLKRKTGKKVRKL